MDLGHPLKPHTHSSPNRVQRSAAFSPTEFFTVRALRCLLSQSFRGGFPGYAFGCGTSGLGYYTDAGGAVMSAEIRAATDLYSKNAPPVKERMPEPAAAASASAAAAESVSVSELQSAVVRFPYGRHSYFGDSLNSRTDSSPTEFKQTLPVQGKVQLGQRAVVCWEDGMEYEAEVISMVTNAVRWLYSSSAAWCAVYL